MLTYYSNATTKYMWFALRSHTYRSHTISLHEYIYFNITAYIRMYTYNNKNT